jgi:K+-sensing histidine kinase KdpD
VEQHGGALVFAPGQPQGTVFTFTLPAQDSGLSLPDGGHSRRATDSRP